jgi:nickel-type superoxide dismutase maturation protease
VVAAALLVAVVAAALRLRRVLVEGDSMSPRLLAGDRLLVVPVRRPRPGDVVAVRHPRDPGRLLVKRVVDVDTRRDRVTVIGDNRRASTDSRDFGPVSRGEVVGRAVYRYAPTGREGRLRRDRPGRERVDGGPGALSKRPVEWGW